MDLVVTSINLKWSVGVTKVNNLLKVDRQICGYRACLLVLIDMPTFVR